MCAHLRQITPEELQELKRNPGSVQQFVHGKLMANRGNLRAQMAAFTSQVLSAKTVENRKATSEKVLAELRRMGVGVPGEITEPGLDIEKSWHGIHYLLNGQPWTGEGHLGNFILGGTEIGDDVGYGPARYLTPAQVRETAEALSKINLRMLGQSVDWHKAAADNIYCFAKQEDVEYCAHYFDLAVQYYVDAAQKGNAMLLYLD